MLSMQHRIMFLVADALDKVKLIQSISLEDPGRRSVSTSHRMADSLTPAEAEKFLLKQACHRYSQGDNY